MKRILKLLRDLASDEPAKYAAFWKEFGSVLKEGVAEDYGNRAEIAKASRCGLALAAARPGASR